MRQHPERAIPASRDEILDMAAYLNIDPLTEPRLLFIARLAVMAPLPAEWEEIDVRFLIECSRIFYDSPL